MSTLSSSPLIKLAINGYGRIGRCVLRAWHESAAYQHLRIVAINEPANLTAMAHLTQYDSSHGRFIGQVSIDKPYLAIDKTRILVTHHTDLTALPWADVGADIVLECSGRYSDQPTLRHHLTCGASKVLLSQPGETALKTIIWGVNQQQLNASDTIISAASCSSNAVVPVLAVLDKAFSIQSGVITMVHAAMNDQPVIDAYHRQDLRKTRSAMQSIVPVDTRLAAGISRVLPHLNGRLVARALRVPTVNVSAIELTVSVAHSVTVDNANATLKAAAQRMDSLSYTEEPLVSCDMNHNPHSAIIDAGQTQVAGSLLTVLIWFDNEWAYANRLLDVANYWATMTATV